MLLTRCAPQSGRRQIDGRLAQSLRFSEEELAGLFRDGFQRAAAATGDDRTS